MVLAIASTFLSPSLAIVSSSDGAQHPSCCDSVYRPSVRPTRTQPHPPTPTHFLISSSIIIITLVSSIASTTRLVIDTAAEAQAKDHHRQKHHTGTNRH